MKALAITAASACAVLLGWQSVASNLSRGCVTGDTPYLPTCEWASRLTRVSTPIDRVSANPGDSAAYIDLAVAATPEQRAPLLEAASRLAPNNPNILVLRAIAALERQDWAGAIPTMVQLVEFREHVPSSQVLARLIVSGHGGLLIEHLKPGSRWLTLVLKQLQQMSGGLSAALPTLAEAARRDAVQPAMVSTIVRELKNNGAWTDAYSLWLSSHPGGLPLLFNGSFDTAFDLYGFDWELQPPKARPGAVLERRAEGGRGFVLNVRLTGASMAVPLVRQYVFLPAGRYRLRGEYESRRLRMESGLAWTVHCGAAGAIGRSSALGENAGRWQPFAYEFTVPANCGPIASLRLEAFAPSEAMIGGLGQMAFDALAIERL